jgi:hypothetical protein
VASEEIKVERVMVMRRELRGRDNILLILAFERDYTNNYTLVGRSEDGSMERRLIIEVTDGKLLQSPSIHD